MAIDIKRLVSDAQALHNAQSRQPGSGTYAAIRKALPAIEAMREKRISWKAIAEALGQQGITQRKDGKDIPITTSRLTALVSDIRSKRARAEDKLAQRRVRGDLSKTLLKSDQSRNFTLSSELAVKPGDATSPADKNDEEAIRRDQYDAIKGLLKNGE